MRGEIVSRLEGIVKERMSTLEDTAHSYKHVKRVLKIAAILAEKENADSELVQIGALLHDVGRATGKPHNETGAGQATRILREMNYPLDRGEKVARIVLVHPLSYRDKLETLEEKIVWDADKIDLMGVTGIMRAFHEAGSRGLPFEEGEKWGKEKGIRIHDSLNTRTAKRIAEARHSDMKHILSALEKELSLQDLQE